MLVAGLTGNIASGKSTVADILRRAGAFIIDADQIAHAVVAPGQPACREIRRLFGPDVFYPDGTLNREALGDLVFNDSAMRRKLEAATHPRVGAEIDRQIAEIARSHPAAVTILDIPLLFETGRTGGLAEIIVVYTPEPIQLQRLMQRNGLTPEAARARMASQMPMAEKVARATIVIDNSGSLADVEKETLTVYRRLAARAAGS